MRTNLIAPPVGLMCELLRFHDGVEINAPHPKFCWMMDDSRPAALQTAFQIMVATSADSLLSDSPDMWNSGKTDFGEASFHVRYDGAPLSPKTLYYWKVRIWDGNDEMSYWSSIREFHTGDLGDSEIHPAERVDFHPVRPWKTIRKNADRLFVDFGTVEFGTLGLELEMDEDRTIEVSLGEVAAGYAEINENPGGARRFKKLKLNLKKGERFHRLEIPPDPTNTKNYPKGGNQSAILIQPHLCEVTPFRYCELSGEMEDVDEERITRLSARYSFDDSTAFFHSSSKVLNDVWRLCEHSIKATSFLGIYIDGDRERVPYEADAYINQLCHYCCDREYALARKSHEYLMLHPNWPTEWIMFSVMMAWEDYEYTGDSSSLIKNYEALKHKTLLALERDDGLLEVTNEAQTEDFLKSINLDGIHKLGDIIDWPECERDSYEIRSVNTVVNAFHAHALELMARIAETIGETEDSKGFHARFAKTKDALNRLMIDKSTGLYIDSEGSSHSSSHANFFPLAFGLVPDDSIPIVADFIESKGMACSVYGAQFLLEALYNAGRAEAALDLMRSTGERSWGHWIYELGATISLEAWSDAVKPNQDWNHAWGAAPGNIIPRFLMGIRPLTPGCECVLIEPNPGSLTYATVKTPTIRGPVSVTFENSPGSSFSLKIEIPANMTAKISLPRAYDEFAAVSLDGAKIAPRMVKGRIVIDSVSSGSHCVDLKSP